MHILFLNQFFWPDPAPTGRLLGDVCHELARRGHKVTVICGRDGYEPSGSDGGDAPPAEIHRVKNLSFSRTRVGRLLSWGSFLVLAGWRSLYVRRVDRVVTMTTPPGLSLIGLLLKRLRGAQFWIWEMDLYPDIAAAVGELSPRSRAYSLLKTLLDWTRRKADGLISLGECMKRRLISKGVVEGRIHVNENWADREIQPRPLPPDRPLTILYSGNLGLAHDLETIHQVMLTLNGDARFRFEFAGGGVLRESLEKFCGRNRLARVSFLPYLSVQEFSDRLASCHIGLVTLRAECLGTLVPSKFYSILAAGRPVLYVGPVEATPAMHIQHLHCGWTYEPGDPAGVVALLRDLVRNPNRLQLAATNARQVFLERFEMLQSVARLATRLTTGDAEPLLRLATGIVHNGERRVG